MTTELKLDHIAIGASSLEEGAAYVKSLLGTDMPMGGDHLKMGTHNLLLRLGEDVYLEVIAINPKLKPPSYARWFSLDHRGNSSPSVSTWIVNSTDIERSIAHMSGQLGPAIDMSRGELEWKITVPEDGYMPYDGYHPTVIEWPKAVHPVNNMQDFGMKLVKFTIESPYASDIQSSLGDGFIDDRVVFEEAKAQKMSAEIETPNGTVVLY